MRQAFVLLIALCLLAKGRGEEIISIPFELDQLRGFVCIQAFVNDKGPYWFIFDTGSDAVGLFSNYATLLRHHPREEAEAASKNDSHADSNASAVIRIEGTAKGKEAKLTLRLGENFFGVIGMESSPVFIRNQFVEPVGIISLMFLNQHFLHISYDDHLIRLLKSSPTDGWNQVPAVRTRTGPFMLRLRIGGEEGEFLLDNGHDGTLSIGDELKLKLKEFLTTRPLYEVTVLSAQSKRQAYAFSARRMPPILLRNLRVNVPWLYSREENLFGSLCMLQFNWLMDLEHDRLYVQPRRKAPPTLRLNQRPPIVIQKRSSDYFIKAGFHTRPYLSGITEESKLLEVNGLNVVNLDGDKNFSDYILQLIMSPFKDQVFLKILKNEKIFEVSFKILDEILVDELLESFVSEIKVEEDGIYAIFKNVQIFETETQEEVPNKQFRVLQIEGRPTLDLTAEDLIEYLHSRLLQNQPAELLCRDESGRERWVKVIPEAPAPPAPSKADTSRK